MKNGTRRSLIFDYVLRKEPTHTGAKIGKAAKSCFTSSVSSRPTVLYRYYARRPNCFADVWITTAAMYAGGSTNSKATESLAMARKLEPEDFDTTVPLMSEFIPLNGFGTAGPRLLPAILAAESASK